MSYSVNDPSLGAYMDAWIERERPEPTPFGFCTDCGCELYEGDTVLEFDGEYYCDNCVDSHRITLER